MDQLEKLIASIYEINAKDGQVSLADVSKDLQVTIQQILTCFKFSVEQYQMCQAYNHIVTLQDCIEMYGTQVYDATWSQQDTDISNLHGKYMRYQIWLKEVKRVCLKYNLSLKTDLMALHSDIHQLCQWNEVPIFFGILLDRASNLER